MEHLPLEIVQLIAENLAVIDLCSMKAFWTSCKATQAAAAACGHLLEVSWVTYYATSNDRAMLNDGLRRAARLGLFRICELLLDHLPGGGAAIADRTMNTAASFGRVDVCRLFLDRGKPVTNSAMNAAVRRGKCDVYKLFLSRGFVPTDDNLISAAAYGQTMICSAILRNRNKVTEMEMSAVVCAAIKGGHERTCRMLTCRGVRLEHVSFAVKNKQWDLSGKLLQRLLRTTDDRIELLKTVAYEMAYYGNFQMCARVLRTMDVHVPLDQLESLRKAEITKFIEHACSAVHENTLLAFE